MPAAWTATDRGVRLHLRVTPNAAASRLEGVEIRDDGSAVLRLRIAAVPDKGRANAAAVALLAKALEVPRSSVVIVSGETSRLKTVEISGEAVSLIARLEAL